MSDIKFDCTQCGQHLTVDATGAGLTVACPKCGQSIIVPQLARLAKSESPKKATWWWSAAGVAVVVLAAGLWVWHTNRRPAIQNKAAPAVTSATANQTLPSDQETGKVKKKWSKEINDAIRDFQNNNDQASANFISGILASLDQPGGMSPAATAANRERINARVRELVRNGALESAATFQTMLYNTFPLSGNNFTGPAHPNHKTGGTPGPGGLVLYLPFDKPDDNGVVHDESGAGNDGQVSGAKWVPDGKFGGAYQFHITNLTDRIIISNSDTLNPDYITVAAWIKAADKDGFWNRIVDKDWRSAYCLDLGGDYNGKGARGKLQVELSAGNTGSDRALDDGQWHHVVGTYDGRTICCYIDGVERGRVAQNSGPLKKNTWDLCIGNSEVDYGTREFLAFDGLIDEVRIYNRALSVEEIKALAGATQAGVGVVSPAAIVPARSSVAEH